MYKKHNFYIHFLCLMLLVSPAYASSLIEKITKLFSVNVSTDFLDSVNSDIVGAIGAKSIKFIIPNKVMLDDVQVLDEHGQRVLYGRRVVLKVSLLSLLTSRVTITEAHVENPYFNYLINQEVHNVIRVFESKKPSLKKSDPRVTIDHITIDNGTFEMNHDAGVVISARGISGEGKVLVEGGPFNIEMSRVAIREGVIKVAGMTLPLKNLKTNNLFISNAKVSSTGLNAIYEQALLSGSGTVFIDKESYDIKATLDAPKNTYPKGLSPLPFVAPAFRAKVLMTGPLVDPEFRASLETGATEFRGLKVKEGRIEALVNSHRILIESADLKVGKEGQLIGNGLIDIDQEKFAFNAKPSRLLSTELSRFLELKLKSAGMLYGQLSLAGNLPAKKPTVFHLKTAGYLQNGEIDRLILAPRTDFNVDLNFALDEPINLGRVLVSDDLGLKLSAKGRLDVNLKRHLLDYELKAGSFKRYIKDLNPGLEAKDFHLKGQLAIRGETWLSSGQLAADSAAFENYEARHLKLDFRANADEVFLSPITAQVFEGNVHGYITIQGLKNDKRLSGKLNVERLNLKHLKNKDLKVLGLVNAELKFAGTSADPVIEFTAEGESLAIDQVSIRSGNVEGEYREGIITIPNLILIDKFGLLNGQNLTLNTKTKAIRGDFHFKEANISLLLAPYVSDIDGVINGPIRLAGTLSAPEISSALVARKVVAFGQKLGQGAISLSLQNEPLIGQEKIIDTVLSLSAVLKEGEGESSIRLGWALKNKTLNSRIDFSELAVDVSTLSFLKTKVGFKGVLSGKLDAKGPWQNIKLDADGRLKDFVFFDPEYLGSMPTKNFGPADFNIKLNNGHLKLDLCASFSNVITEEKCNPKPGMTLAINGPFDFTSYDLTVRANVDHDHLENIFTSLRRELAIVSAVIGVDGRLMKRRNSAATFKANLQLERLQASLPTIPHIELSHPVNVSLSENSLTLNDQAILAFAPGLLALKGSLSPSSVDLDIQGAMPLMLMRLFVPIVQRAEGLAMGHIRISGTPEAPLLDGKIEPERGSLMTFNKYFESLQFKAGQVIFKRTGKYSFTTDLSAIRLGVGDGRLLVDGRVEKQYPRKKKLGKTIFNVQMEGSNVVLKSGNQFIETDFKLETVKGATEKPTLRGNIVVTDGLAYRQFDLRNFVAQAYKDQQSSPLKFLENTAMNIDVEVAIRQFKAAARMLNINVDTNLTGHLRAVGTLNHPKITGSLSVTEGKIFFPSVTFDLYESRIDLDENSEKVFDPRISLVSTYELEKDLYPDLARDTTIQLELKGSVDRLMLDLKPIRGDLKLSPTKIFLLLFMPQSFAEDNSLGQLDIMKRRAQNAALAFSGEVFLRPLTNELQNLLEGRTKTRIQFGSSLEPGGITLRLSWKIGPRIEAQGSYMFMSDDNLPTAGKSTFLVDHFPLSDLKLKLLLFDHRPFGPLFFEGSFGANRLRDGGFETRSSLKLNYRVLSK